MTFISWKTMRKLIEKKDLIKNPKKKYLKKKDFSSSGASIDLSLGEEVFITPESKPTRLSENDKIQIQPRRYAALISEEELSIPIEYLGFITIRFKYKSKGLVNISGFHVDPGFQGRLIFTVYNIGPKTIQLTRGEKIFSLFLAKIEQGAEYEGEFANKKGIPLSIIESLTNNEDKNDN